MAAFQTIKHEVDFCVVGGGLSGLCAAVAAARHGARVALMQDRPMLGGNASSEVRMWVCGAHGENNRETGIIEELMMENYYRNPYKNYSIWDSIMFEKARFQPGVELILNCSCLDAVMDGQRIVSIRGWQSTTQKYHEVTASIFADCSGDSVLAPLTGAEFRIGREASAEFGEDIAPPVADQRTMGMSCLIQARETTEKREYIPPFWAEKYTKEMLPHRRPHLKSDMRRGENFWYLELGGMGNSIDDTEKLRDELLGVAYGMWDYVKNSPDYEGKNDNLDLDWIGMLPGKRESRRYVGDYIMTQNDVRAEGKFDDIVAYGGWTMDDHHPGGFRTSEKPTIFHPAPSPFGIAYRCMYSKNIANLMFAGRNISVTHAAMSATRVMATCATIGQAVGTAAAIATQHGTSPRGVYEKHLRQLQQTLMLDDSWLPFAQRELSALTREASLASNGANAEALRCGVDRPRPGSNNVWTGGEGAYAAYSFSSPRRVARARFVFDSDLERVTQPEGEFHRKPMYASYFLDAKATYVPKTMVRDFRLVLTLADGGTKTVEVKGNYQRLVFVDIDEDVTAVCFEPTATWGGEQYRAFAFDLLP